MNDNLTLWQKVKKPVIIILMLWMILITINSASAVPSGGLSFWNLTKLTDEWSSLVFICTDSGSECSGTSVYPTFGDGSTTGYNSSFDFDGGDYLTITHNTDGSLNYSTNDFTISVWTKFDLIATNSGFIYSKGSYGTSKGFGLYQATTNLVAKTYGAGDSSITESFTNLGIGAGKWVNIIFTREETGNGSNITMWVNGTIKTTKTSIHRATQDIDATEDLYVGFYGSGGAPGGNAAYQFEGNIDHLQFFNRALTPAEITTLFQTGTLPDSTPGNPFIIIKAYDAYDNSSIDNFTVNLNNGTSLTTTNGSVIFNNTIGNYSFNITNIFGDTGVYFNLTGIPNYTYVEAAANATTYTKLVYPFQSVINFTGYDLHNNTLTGVTFYVNGTSGTTFYLKNNTNYELTGVKAGYYNKTDYFNVSPLDIKTVNLTGMYTTRLLVSPRDIINNNTISSANITISNSTYSYTSTATSVTNATFNLTNGVYLLSISAPNRINYSENITVTNGSYTYYAYMYAYNSVWVYAYDQVTGSPINTFNVSIQNATHSYTNSTTTGFTYINNIPSGNYDVIIIASGYSNANYVITVTDNSHQTLNAYLTSANDTFIFTVKDKSLNTVIEGVVITQKRLINGTLTTIASESSDITGRVQFGYVDGVEYTFTATKTGYVSRTFNLEILFPTYTLLLTPSTTLNESVYIDDVVVTNNGYSFTSTGILSFYSLIFTSAGQLEDYYINITSAYNNTYVNGSNANGGTLNASLNISGASIGDLVTVSYGYKSTVNAGYKNYVVVYQITTFTPGASTLSRAREYFNGRSNPEKVVIATIIAIIFASIIGFGGLLAGSNAMLGGGFGAFIGFIISYYLGLISTPVLGLTGFVLVMIIASRIGGDY